MNFTEVVSEVLDIVKRPDKIITIRREVNSALNFCCNETELARDLIEQSIIIANGIYIQSIPLSDFTRFRKFKYLKTPGDRHYLSPIAPDKVFQDRIEACNAYYISGDQVIIRLRAMSSLLLVGWYAYPPTLTDSNSNFWLLDVSPYMIIDRAASKVFSSIGDDSSARTKMAEFAVSWLSARRDLALGVMP